MLLRVQRQLYWKHLGISLTVKISVEQSLSRLENNSWVTHVYSEVVSSVTPWATKSCTFEANYLLKGTMKLWSRVYDHKSAIFLHVQVGSFFFFNVRYCSIKLSNEEPMETTNETFFALFICDAVITTSEKINYIAWKSRSCYYSEIPIKWSRKSCRLSTAGRARRDHENGALP